MDHSLLEGLMQIAIEDRGAFASAIVQLGPGETFVSESGAMYRTSAEVDTDVTTCLLYTSPSPRDA